MSKFLVQDLAKRSNKITARIQRLIFKCDRKKLSWINQVALQLNAMKLIRTKLKC